MGDMTAANVVDADASVWVIWRRRISRRGGGGWDANGCVSWTKWLRFMDIRLALGGGDKKKKRLRITAMSAPHHCYVGSASLPCRLRITAMSAPHHCHVGSASQPYPSPRSHHQNQVFKRRGGGCPIAFKGHIICVWRYFLKILFYRERCTMYVICF